MERGGIAKGSLRQRSHGSWEFTIDQGRDAFGKRCRKSASVRGTKAAAQRELRELLSTLDRGIDIPDDRINFRDWLRRRMRQAIEPGNG